MSPQSESRDRRSENQSRWIELAITIVVSAIASGSAVTWTLSSTLEEFRSKIAEHDRTIAAQWTRINAMEGVSNANGAQVSAITAHYDDILRRLDSIDRKLERK